MNKILTQGVIALLLVVIPFYFFNQYILSKQSEARIEEKKNTLIEQQKNSTLEQILINTEKEKLQLKEQLENIKKELEKAQKISQAPEPVRMVALVKEYFPEDTETAISVFKAESGLNPRQQGWNCRYGKESKSCKPQDRSKAWSIDCGLAQINIVGKLECPAYSLDPRWSLAAARKKYDRNGWSPWVAYTQGKNSQHLSFAATTLAFISN